MLRWFGGALALIPLVLLLSAFSETWLSPSDYAGMPAPGAVPSPTSYPFLRTLLAHASPQVSAGAHTYHVVCATCHGPTGKGLAEAKLEFGPDHRDCQLCHRPDNPARWADMQIGKHDSFSIGHPPPLRTPALLRKYPTPSALFRYLRSAMPRYDPGKFSDTQYRQLTAFLLALNGAMPADATLKGPVARLVPSDLAVRASPKAGSSR